MENISGVVERITYANEKTGYCVIKIKSKGYSELVSVVGNMAFVNVGTVVLLTGKWEINPKYGRQFNAEHWKETLPATVHGIKKYLASGLVKGIGPKYAKLIVEKFKENTIEIIENSPDRLYEVRNIGQKRVQRIIEAWKEQKDIKDLMIFLQSYNVSTAYGHRIYKEYREKSIDIIKDNPYQLVDDIYGIGFKTADTIAIKMGININSYSRCRSGIFYVLSRSAGDGHCYMEWDALIYESVEILGVEEPIAVMTASHLIQSHELIKKDENRIYLPPFFYAEIGAAKRLKTILRCKRNSLVDVTNNELEQLQTQMNIVYDSNQANAIRLAVTSKFIVLTGGPGTGKTTITKAIITILEKRGLSVLLAAPTGRAAKKMCESCGMEAKTIHRLLGSKPPNEYEKNEKNQFQGDVLIIDESSMIDILLLNSLLKATPDTMSVILIGDVDQLPSVGAGNVLKDIIDSRIVPVIRLTQIYRQAANSLIITSAHQVNSGICPNLSNKKSSDFFFIESSADNILKQIIELCKNRLPHYYRIDPMTDIQVLSPMNQGESGTGNLNLLLQRELNPNQNSLRRGGTDV